MDETLKSKRVLVAGLGLNKGGESTVRYLARHHARVTVTDLKSPLDLAPTLHRLRSQNNVRYVLGKHRFNDFTAADLIFRNPGVPETSPYIIRARAAGVAVTNDAAYFMAHARGTVVGITGTRGKSTTAALIYAMVHAANPRKTYLAGNIATRGALSILDALTPSTIAILELSSFQLEHFSDVRKSPSISVLTSFSADHLNRYSSLSAYADAKKNIFRYQEKSHIAILPDVAPVIKRFLPTVVGTKYLFSNRRKVRGAYLSRGAIFFYDGSHAPRKILPVADIPLHQTPYIENVLAAVTVASILRIPPSVIRTATRSFRGLPFRLEVIAQQKATVFINDSCATSPAATERALQVLQKPIVLIAGGENKNMRFDSLARSIKQSVQHLILLPGSASKALQRALSQIQYKNMTSARDLQSALLKAYPFIGSARTIILSPAAASFNMFTNEFDRGRQFSKAVKTFVRKYAP